jgi:hypothetical protein
MRQNPLEDYQMSAYRVIAIPTNVAEEVRISHNSPRYGHPTSSKIATGYGPCRHCLRTFHVGKESRTLFTLNPFDGIEEVPLPGPVFIHTESCERYPENGGYPVDLLEHAAVLSGYAKGQRLVEKIYADNGEQVAAVNQLFGRSDIDYIEVRDKIAGCFDFRIERIADECTALPEREFKC